ncbi:MAG: Rrf2 family transcriptional regulator [Campylobacterales bacterium]|nr:Rrf2 family transcriptional regulator [Campylobacterales bacterium]NQY20193.1 Rrf2 family transcriptional regulator [Campylobacteraceae bacterium]NQY52487.1 Rrf2 family transcriptional regulator [Campylobacteraceae bacterium]
MPLISSKGVYGLTAMHELSKNTNDKPMQIREISNIANIPQNYLEQLLSKLRRAELVTSVRGSKGGYHLARNASDITVLEILLVLEDDLKIADNKCSNPILDIFFDEVKEKTQKLFELNLNELDKYLEKFNENLHYSI